MDQSATTMSQHQPIPMMFPPPFAPPYNFGPQGRKSEWKNHQILEEGLRKVVMQEMSLAAFKRQVSVP